MGRYFGTDGFRGEANVDLTADHALCRWAVFWAGTTVRPSAAAATPRPVRVVIGKDTRRSSYMFEYALASGTGGLRRGCLSAACDHHALRVLCGADGRVRLRHHDLRQPQPLLRQRHQAHQRQRREDGRGHHRPGRGLSGRQAGGVRPALAAASPAPPAGPHRPHGGLCGRAATATWATSSPWAVSPSRASASAWTAPTAAPGPSPKSVFEALGAKTYVMGDRARRASTSTTAWAPPTSRPCSRFVLDNELDVGFAYDGDADRCLCRGRAGRRHRPATMILYIYGRYMKAAVASCPTTRWSPPSCPTSACTSAFDRERASPTPRPPWAISTSTST